jgi:hypothetical protein
VTSGWSGSVERPKNIAPARIHQQGQQQSQQLSQQLSQPQALPPQALPPQALPRWQESKTPAFWPALHELHALHGAAAACGALSL